MIIKIVIDNQLIDAAVKIGHHKSKKDAVTAALKEYIQNHKQKQILELFGKIEFDPEYDYKNERKRK